MFHAFNLAQILYLPRDGRGESLVGEELLDWVNAVDTVHINDQGNAIMGAKNSWEQESFFPFIVRCVLRGFFQPAALLLRTLEKHPHPPIARLGTKLAASVESFPRSTSVDAYPLDHQFIAAHKLWLAQFRADLATFEGGRGRGHWFDDGGAGRSAWASWEDDFRSVTELLEGKTERLFAEVADWREALGAWGVLIDVSLRRDDLPRALARIVDELPIDSTVIEDSIHASLCSGDIIKVLMDAYTLDRWLAAHLGDVFDKLALIPDDDEHFDTSLRDYYLLDYADMLQESSSQPELWRVICEYLAAAGEQGRSRLRAYIVHVGGMTSKPRKGDMVDEDEDEDQSAAQFERFTELREVCAEYKLEDEWRTISKTVAESLIRRGDLGVAASICLTSEDGYQLSRIAEKIMAAFVTSGEAEFQRLVNSLPESMLHEAPQKFTELHLGGAAALDDDSLRAPSRTTMVMFASRLAFLSEFRDYLLYLDQGSRDLAAKKLVNLLTSGITPVEFWGVLLAQSIDLLEGK